MGAETYYQRMDINFSSELKAVLDLSRQEAIRHNNTIITPEHLLLALLADTGSRVFTLLEKISRNVSVYQLRQELDSGLYNAEAPVGGEVAVSDLANRLVKLSVLEARMLRSSVVDTEHLLLAILHNPEIQRMEFIVPFRQAGIDYTSLLGVLSNNVRGNDPHDGTSYSEDEDDEDEDNTPSGTGGPAQGGPREEPRRESAAGRQRGADTPTLDKFGNDMLCSILFLSLIFDVLTDHFYWCPSCRQKAETLAPKCFFPKFFPDFRILFFQQSAAGTFISIDKFTEFCFRLCTKHYMHMVNIMIPFLQNNSIPWGNISPYFLCSF